MSRAVVVLLVLTLAGCATYTPMRIVSFPPEKTEAQRAQDDTECSRVSQVHGPWVFGIGTAIMRDMAITRYTECMKEKGYVVERRA